MKLARLRTADPRCVARAAFGNRKNVRGRLGKPLMDGFTDL